MMEFDDIVKTFGSKTVNMIEAKPVNIDYLLGRKWELPQINKPIIKYPTSSSLYDFYHHQFQQQFVSKVS